MPHLRLVRLSAKPRIHNLKEHALNTSDPQSDPLTAALSAARIPAANHEFIREITRAVGIDVYRFVEQHGKPYVIATRRDGLHDLHIYYGATNGFYS
jgi:hypothetical protein